MPGDELKRLTNSIQSIAPYLEDIIILIDTEYKIVYFSRSAQGLTIEELKGVPLYEVVEASQRDELRKHFDDTLKQNGPVTYYTEFERPPGNVVYYESIAKPVADQSGKQIGIIITSRDISARRYAEQALNKNETAFLKSIEQSPFPIAINDKDGVFTFVNQAMLDIFGYEDIDEMNATSYRERYLPEYYQNVEERKARRLRGEFVNEHMQHRLVRKNGEVRNVDVMIEKIWLHNKEQYQVTYNDITKQKEAERELLIQAQLLNDAYDGICLIDYNGTIVYVNDTYCTVHGYDRDYLVGKNIRDIPTDTTPEVFEEIDRTLKKQRQAIFETTHYHKNGTPIILEVHSRVVEIDGQSFSLNIERDITERKRIENVLAENYSFLETVTASLGATVFTVKLPERTVEWANDTYDIFGFYPDFMVGKTTESLYASRRDFEEFGEGLQAAIQSGVSTVHYDALLKRMSGETFDAEIYTSIYREKSVPLRVISVVRDVTERRKREEDREKAARLESIGTLAGGIAHDFNNILTGIMGNIGLAEMLIREGKQDEVSGLLNEAERASLKARDLTQQLLTFSRGGEPVKKILAIGTLLKTSVDFAVRGSSVKPDYSIAQDLCPVEVDEGQINQVINNVVINAVQAMPGGGKLTVEAVNRKSVDEDSVNFIEISFRDSGIGIPEQNLKRVFEPYFTTKQRGSGLGLATSYSIITKHDGEMTIESELGSGTTIKIYLPASGKDPSAEDTDALQKITPGHGRILVMDDEESIRALLTRGLGSAGYDVTGVENGEQAIEAYTEAREQGIPYDVVIMDLTIPGGMGGKDAVQEIIKIDPSAVVIVSSGYSTDPIMANYRDYGFSGVVSKPYRMVEVEKLLADLLNP